jgi:hypothetical protein
MLPGRPFGNEGFVSELTAVASTEAASSENKDGASSGCPRFPRNNSALAPRRGVYCGAVGS